MRFFIKILLICILIGLAFGLYTYYTINHRPEQVYINTLSSVCIGGLLCILIYNRHYFINNLQNPVGKIIIILGLLIIVALVGTELTLLLRSALWSQQPFKWFNGGNIYILNTIIVFVIGIPMYVSEEWRSQLNSRILQQQYRLLQLEQQQTVFELELLRAKINPHFLYNVHNSIAGLITTNPQKAEQLVILLSKFFRFTLNKNSSTFHTVADEVEIISTYLHMQQIRYENRMQFNIRVAPTTNNLLIPSFILQPLVENAVKHGIESSSDKGSIDVTIQLTGEHIIITIHDTGPAFPEEPSSGMGLQMVMNKIKLLYPTGYSIELINQPSKHVRLSLPGRN
ncbi:histidine kinase/DNA gyrase B/HSP90-like ATPase [Chitinophaga dinghuensis]|uniref:Histidine kinase/DNA gyrase B/HSP90-like ATPase n=1 Tax=Chitinophaga dinghuensis TaxID=1539050 RepID=A0A327VK94_9BACT|nr:histidine kinase [Chitinophaga dinghuensis]RAJ72791.1 histidine kinase/DNA gyrase B/HSP90-like ATPase [Chitinophaga dinghuensis]